MANLPKIPRRQLILLLLMLGIGFFFVRRYVDFTFPTSNRIEEKLQTLNSLRKDLQLSQKMSEERLDELSDLQGLAAPYWFSTGQRAMVDQEITKEFGKILRQAQLPSNHKVDVQRNKLPGANHIQEVQIKLDLRGISMQEVSRLFNEVHKYGKKLSWNYCRIEPDNPRTPKNVNLSARLRALVLNPDAVDYLNGEPISKNGKGVTIQ